MNRNLVGLVFSFLAIGILQAEIFINETFDDSLGRTLKGGMLQRAAAGEVVNGHDAIGADPAFRFLDESAAVGGILEYNVGEAPPGALLISFDLLNNAPDKAGEPNPLIFCVGQWVKGKGVALGANATRAFGVEFLQTGDSKTLAIRIGKSAAKRDAYTLTALQQVKIWVNDNDSRKLAYIRPDTKATAMLDPDSCVVWVNDKLVSGEPDSGIAMQTSVSTGDAVLGRLGFSSSSTSQVDFLIDNLYVENVSPKE